MKNRHDRFREKYVVNPDGCWLWRAATDRDGYGVFWTGTKLVGAHRFAWARVNGIVPGNMVVCHRCDHPGCVNPDHLFLGTQLDNIADMDAKHRRADPSQANTAKLTWIDVAEIRLSSGRTARALAEDYGVTVGTICSVRRHATWIDSSRPIPAPDAAWRA